MQYANISTHARNMLKLRPYGVAVSRIIEADLDTVASVLDDYGSHHRWVPFLVQAEKLKTISILERLICNRMKFPWPAYHREFILRVEAIPDHKNKTLICIMRSDIAPRVSTQHRIVRGELEAGSFSLAEITPMRTRVEMMFSVNPKGLIPIWLCNLLRYPWSHLVLKGLAREVSFRQT